MLQGHKIKFFIILVLFLSLFLFSNYFLNRVFSFPYLAHATSGACSGHGGVNCSAGADYDGSVICYDGWNNSSVSYSSMVMCQSNSSYNYPSYSSTPSCPSMSSYDSLSGSCKCYAGYVVGTDFLGKQACVSADSKCTTDYGYGAQYSYLYNRCECKYGYIMSGSQCISGDTYCTNNYGYGSEYDSLSKDCECRYGYIMS